MKNQTALNEYLLDLKLRNCSPRTIKTMKNNMSLLFNWIEAEYEIKEIEDIRRNHIKGYLQYKNIILSMSVLIYLCSENGQMPWKRYVRKKNRIGGFL